MAGGGGTRFWPLSREKKPKQFLNLTGKDLLVNETFDRLKQVVDAEDIFVVTNRKFRESTYVCMQGRVGKSHILAEPDARNTAACIGYAAMEILKKYGDGVLCVVPSDHYIQQEDLFAETLRNAMEVAERKNCPVTVGITPTYASTGFGYIRCLPDEGKTGEGVPFYRVAEFMEKPDSVTAERYVGSGEYSWNSGMFLFKASVILQCFKELLPKVYQGLEQIGNAMNTADEDRVLNEVYPEIPKISIDYGIMEQADEIYMLKGTFGWNDVGSLNELAILQQADEDGNICFGETEAVDSAHSILYSDSRLLAAVGVENIIAVETEDAVLVCDRDRAQDVKKLVEKLKQEKKDRYL